MDQRRKRILFVHDDANFLDVIHRVLHDQQNAWDLFYAFGVEGAITELSSHGIDTVLTDVGMRDGDGFTVLRLIRDSKAYRHIPVIMLTGPGDSELKAIAICLGAHDILTKPVGEEELLARIRSALHCKSLQDELRQANTPPAVSLRPSPETVE